MARSGGGGITSGQTKTEKKHRKVKKETEKTRKGKTTRTTGPLAPMPARKNGKKALARQGDKEAALRR
jgi:hypothetical protein